MECIRVPVGGIMLSHIWYQAIDTQRTPASLSPNVVNMLRQDLRFDGLIFTDDLEMGAITQNYSIRRAAVKAVQAGADVLLVTQTPERQKAAFEGLVEAVQKGQISESRIDQSVQRIWHTSVCTSDRR